MNLIELTHALKQLRLSGLIQSLEVRGQSAHRV